MEKPALERISKAEKSWILYDVANSAFVLIVVTTLMPVFIKEVAFSGLAPEVSTARWGIANSMAAMILALAAPVLGTLADYPQMKKKFLGGFMLTGVFSTLILTFMGYGSGYICLVVFILARIGFAGANIFYDAFLIDVSPKARIDWVSSLGFGFGYIGSVIPFAGVILLIRFIPETLDFPLVAVRLGFGLVAIWWFVFTIPLLKHVKQLHNVSATPHPVKEGFKRLGRTLMEIRQYKGAFIFLLSYFFYIDAVHTIITMAVAYGRDIGLTLSTMIPVILMIQIIGFPFAILFGKLAVVTSTRFMLYFGIVMYFIINLLAFFLPDVQDVRVQVGLFWLLAFLIATSQGGIQALSRSMFGKLIPADRSAEFFGFYNIFGKFAAILGPLLMGLIGQWLGHSKYGILAVMGLLAAGGIFLAMVPLTEEQQQAKQIRNR